jgi:RNA polymerase sigma-70 factor (ECF subfamily)
MLKITHSVPDSEEITQEVFVRLWNMRESVDPERNFGALAFTIARRIAIDMYRQRGHLKVVVPDEPEDGVSGDRSPQEILEEREEALLLDIAIESMPSRQREVFSMYYYQNLSPKEIATRTGLSYDNVRRQIYNAKRDLRGVVMLISMFLLSQ